MAVTNHAAGKSPNVILFAASEAAKSSFSVKPVKGPLPYKRPPQSSYCLTSLSLGG